MSQAHPRRRRRSNNVDSSGSWSDVSDCESTSPRSNVNKGRKSVENKSRSSAHSSGAAASTANELDIDGIDERLTKSLEFVENGVGDLDCPNPQSLPSDTVWNHYDSPSRSSSLPSSGMHLVQNGANGHDHHNETELDQSDKIKNKLMSAWNNVRHG